MRWFKKWEIFLKTNDISNWAFKLWCWRRLVKFPWTARRSSQLILKEINPEYSLEGLMLKLKFFGHLMQRALEKTLILGKIESKRKRGKQRMRWFDSIINWMDLNLSKLQEIVKDRGAWCAAVHGITKSQTWLRDWTTTMIFTFYWLHSLVAQMLKNLPAKQETLVWFLSQEDPLEKGNGYPL